MKFLSKFLLIAFSMTVVSTMVNAQAKVAFEISFAEPQAHYVDVLMEISGNKNKALDIKMPVWAPGSYLIREFAKNIENVSATGSKGGKLEINKINKNTWRINSADNDIVKIKYQVYAFEVSVRTSFVDDSHAFLSPTGIFMFVDGQLNQPATVSIKAPNGWDKISTGLENLKGKASTFFAPNFDALYDSPIEIGNQDTFEFMASGVKHEVAM